MLTLSNVALLALVPQIASSHPFASKRSAAAPPVSDKHVSLNHTTAKLTSRDTGLTGGPHYFGDFSFSGTPVQAIVDTGSSDLAIRSDAIPASSYHDVTGSCSESYGGRQPLTGQVATGGYQFAGFDVGGRFCLLDSSVSSAQGVMGLGFIPPGGNTVAAQYGDGPLIQYGIRGLTSFAIYLSSEQGGGGTFTVNGRDEQYESPDDDWIYESRNQDTAHWAFPLAGDYQIGDGDYQWGSGLAIVDSGNPVITVPPSTASAIWQAVGANSDGTYNDCDPGGDPVYFQSPGGNGFIIEAVHYVVPNPGGGCRNAFQPSVNAQPPFIVLGTPFMKQYYVYFDYSNQEIGFIQSSG